MTVVEGGKDLLKCNGAQFETVIKGFCTVEFVIYFSFLSATSFGIALPSWLVSKENSMWVS